MRRLFRRLIFEKVTSVHLELTNYCTLKCDFCPIHKMKRSPRNMSFDLIKHIVKKNPNVRAYGLNVWGEPLLHPQFKKIVAYLKSRRKKVFFATNATLLTREMSIFLCKADIDGVYFSIDGANKYYEDVRHYSYEKVRQNVRTFLSLKDELGCGADTKIICVVSRPDKHAPESLMQDWEGVCDVYCQAMVTYEYRQLRNDCGIEYSRHLTVFANGQVTPCCVDYDGVSVIGNAWQQSLDDIYDTLPKVKDTLQICHYCSEYEYSGFNAKRFGPDKSMKVTDSIPILRWLKLGS